MLVSSNIFIEFFSREFLNFSKVGRVVKFGDGFLSCAASTHDAQFCHSFLDNFDVEHVAFDNPKLISDFAGQVYFVLVVSSLNHNNTCITQLVGQKYKLCRSEKSSLLLRENSVGESL